MRERRSTAHSPFVSAGFEAVDELLELGQLFRAVDLDNRELALGNLGVRNHRPASRPGGPVRQLAQEGGPAQRVVWVRADRAAVVAQHPGDLFARGGGPPAASIVAISWSAFSRARWVSLADLNMSRPITANTTSRTMATM